MANKTKLLSLWIMLLALVGVSFTTYASTSNAYQPTVHNNDLNFQASYDNGVVNMTWNTFTPTSSNWKYRKVMRSTTNKTPYYRQYADQKQYIKYANDVNFTSYTDTNPPAGTVYYGICAITENSYGKYRNCDWQAVTVDSEPSLAREASSWMATWEPRNVAREASSWIATWKSSGSLSSSLRGAVDAMMEKLLNNLENKFGDDRNAKISLLETLSTKLDGIKVNYRLKPMITYLVEKIDEAVALLQIEALLDID